MGKSVLIGAITGTAMGVLLGYGIGSDEDCGFFAIGCTSASDKASLYGSVFGVLGALIGAGSGAAKIVIPIGGNKSTYKSVQGELAKYKLVY